MKLEKDREQMNGALRDCIMRARKVTVYDGWYVAVDSQTDLYGTWDNMGHRTLWGIEWAVMAEMLAEKYCVKFEFVLDTRRRVECAVNALFGYKAIQSEERRAALMYSNRKVAIS